MNTEADSTLTEAADTLFYIETSAAGNCGDAGIPVPYTIRGDDFLVSLLLMGLLVLVVSVSRSRNFIWRQLRNLFYVPRNSRNIGETVSELYFQMFLVLLSCLQMTFIAYMYADRYLAEAFVGSEKMIMTILISVFIGYHLFKAGAYMIVNSVFFPSQKSNLWIKLWLFINAMQGVLLFAITLLVVFLDLSLKNAQIIYSFIIILIKILTFYKCWSIFFMRKRVFLQTFLYFCTLEIVPLLLLIGGLFNLIDQLKLN